MDKQERERTSSLLRSGGIVVMPTDTIYGLVGQALKPKTVARIYKVRRRSPDKPCIILIGGIEDLKKFGIAVNSSTRKLINSFWPGKVSIVLPCMSKRFTYLHRGTETLAFRLPKPLWLRRLLKQTGPLVAPSANLEGKEPATTVREAQKYFRNRVDAYVDGGTFAAKPSTLIAIQDGVVEILRQGRVRLRV